MRSVSIVLLSATVEDVRERLRGAGFERFPDEARRWNYPRFDEAVLLVTCDEYDVHIVVPEEDEIIVSHAGGERPKVMVTANVSGTDPGDDEVRHLVETLLGTFRGFAFDDYASLDHAWKTLDEIRGKVRVSGVGFFDYRGQHARMNRDG